VTLFYDGNQIKVDLSAISHINKYGDTPHCIIEKNYFMATCQMSFSDVTEIVSTNTEEITEIRPTVSQLINAIRPINGEDGDEDMQNILYVCPKQKLRINYSINSEIKIGENKITKKDTGSQTEKWLVPTKILIAGKFTKIIQRGSGSNLAAAGLAMMAEKPLGPDEIDSVPESWVELAPSRASLSSSIEAVNIGENSVGGGIISQRDSRLSPVSIQSPAVEFESSLEQVKYRLVKSMIGPDVGGNTNKSSTDWLWEWAYRSDGGASNDKPKNNLVINSTLTTPPNSPEPEETTDFFTFKSPGGKLYHRRIVSNKKLFDWSMFCRLDVLLAIVVSNLITGAVVYVFV
uniref:Uncharacterized protein n=1 Tax=Meloidogyne floridensis TaxID=298350 RepID=A0A915PFH2_9BILA